MHPRQRHRHRRQQLPRRLGVVLCEFISESHKVTFVTSAWLFINKTELQNESNDWSVIDKKRHKLQSPLTARPAALQRTQVCQEAGLQRQLDTFGCPRTCQS